MSLGDQRISKEQDAKFSAVLNRAMASLGHVFFKRPNNRPVPHATGVFISVNGEPGLVMADHSVGRQHIRQGRLEFTQQKNRRRSPVRVVIPLTPPLAEALAGWQGSGLTFLETANGRPFSADGLSNAFREWCDAADLPQCTFHGLRKAAATRLAEAGCTPHQIMAVLGHTTHQQAALYTRAADRAGMADQALGRLYGEQMDPPVDLGGFQFGEKILMDQTPKRSLAVPRGRR